MPYKQINILKADHLSFEQKNLAVQIFKVNLGHFKWHHQNSRDPSDFLH